MFSPRFFWFLSAVIVICASPTHAQKKNAKPGNLSGTLTHALSGDELAGAISLTNKVFERSLNVSGRFLMEKIPPGSYLLRAIAPGFEQLEQTITITSNQTETIELKLEPKTLQVSEMVVAPSTFSIFRQPQNSQNYLDRETLKNTPHFNDDVLRAVESLPGTSSNDFGAAFTVRGGESREVSILLDGMELLEPYHLKDFTGVFSYFDPQVLGGLNLSTGGYDAKYGNAMSGILEMETVSPTTQRNIASLSLGNISFQTEGQFAGGLGSYMFSGRRGYLDLLLSISGDSNDGENEESDINYYDSVGKVSYILNSNQRLQWNYLIAGDTFKEKEGVVNEDLEQTDANYQDFYTWLSWDSQWRQDLSSKLVVYRGDLSQKRTASSIEPDESYNFRDNRELQYTGAKWDWEWSVNPNHFLRWGVDFRSVKADYDYDGLFSSAAPITDRADGRTQVQLKPEGEAYSAYLTERFRLGDAWIFEAGLRYDKQNLLDDSQFSPRLNATYQLGPQRNLRFAVGNFYQAERAHDLQIADGVSTFSKPEKATHYLVSYEQMLPRQIDFRAEAYYKDISDPRTRYENLTRTLVRYPGGSQDRFQINPDSSEIYGLELVFKQNLGGKFSWFSSYAWSKAEDTIGSITQPRQREQEHSFNFNASYRFGRKWNFNAAWLYHTGWRVTPLNLVAGQEGYSIVPGEIYSEKLPAYHRLDLRINRAVFVGQKRSFELYIDIFNAYNRKNLRGFESYGIIQNPDGTAALARERENWLPILPSFGLSWKF